MSRRSTKQRRAARRRREGYAVRLWLDECARIVCRRLAGACQRFVTEPAKPWFRFTLKETP